MTEPSRYERGADGEHLSHACPDRENAQPNAGMV